MRIYQSRDLVKYKDSKREIEKVLKRESHGRGLSLLSGTANFSVSFSNIAPFAIILFPICIEQNKRKRFPSRDFRPIKSHVDQLSLTPVVNVR